MQPHSVNADYTEDPGGRLITCLDRCSGMFIPILSCTTFPDTKKQNKTKNTVCPQRDLKPSFHKEISIGNSIFPKSKKISIESSDADSTRSTYLWMNLNPKQILKKITYFETKRLHYFPQS